MPRGYLTYDPYLIEKVQERRPLPQVQEMSITPKQTRPEEHFYRT